MCEFKAWPSPCNTIHTKQPGSVQLKEGREKKHLACPKNKRCESVLVRETGILYLRSVDMVIIVSVVA